MNDDETPPTDNATDQPDRSTGNALDEALALRHDRILAAELEEAGIDVTPVDDRLPEQIEAPPVVPAQRELPYAFEDLP